MPVGYDMANALDELRDPLPVDPLEREVLAHRLVAERCLYGVDRNPMAVEMAKLSLWLVTLAKDRPFSFLDHALREGDSLLGVTSLDQVKALHMDPRRGRALHARLRHTAPDVDAAVDEALRLRDELESFVVRDVRDAQRKAQLHAEATAALADVRLLADVVGGAALANGDGDDLDDALASVEMHVSPVLDPDAPADARAVARQALAEASERWLQHGRVDVSFDRRCFHWALELPEVWRRGGFDAVVGNPPFQGGQKITGAHGTSYRELLVAWLAGGRRGSADLVSYFVLRAAHALRPGGIAGVLATNTIGQGDTREVGLDALLADGYALLRAVPSEPWPGGANLEVAHLWLRRDGWSRPAVLDGRSVRAITASLEAASRVAGTAARLAANAGQSFQGSNVLGMGFVLTPAAAADLIARDARNANVVRPYLNGEDLNSRPDCSPSRCVIDFRDWPIERAREYSEPFEIVERLVRPERALNKDRRRRELWWQFTRPVPELYRAIARSERVLVIAQVSKTVMPVFVPAAQVFAHKLVVFAYRDASHLGLLSSGFHYWWTIVNSATMRADLSYSPTDCFEKLPQPIPEVGVTAGAGALDTHRSALMVDRQEGLTKTYNRVHDPAESAADIIHLRELHVALDYAVRDAYGWNDLDLGHAFHATRQGTRFTFEPIVRQEVLDRLLKLNHERRAAEEAAGLHAKKNPARKPAARAPAAQATIFDGG